MREATVGIHMPHPANSLINSKINMIKACLHWYSQHAHPNILWILQLLYVALGHYSAIFQKPNIVNNCMDNEVRASKQV